MILLHRYRIDRRPYLWQRCDGATHKRDRRSLAVRINGVSTQFDVIYAVEFAVFFGIELSCCAGYQYVVFVPLIGVERVAAVSFGVVIDCQYVVPALLDEFCAYRYADGCRIEAAVDIDSQGIVA